MKDAYLIHVRTYEESCPILEVMTEDEFNNCDLEDNYTYTICNSWERYLEEDCYFTNDKDEEKFKKIIQDYSQQEEATEITEYSKNYIY
jgi:hypothetical protein